MIKVAKDIGKERFYRYARAFGFGEATGVNIAGEAKGLLKEPKDWSGMTLPSMAFGQEVGVTALQLTSAYCAVANDGILMKPRLVEEVYDQKGKRIESYPPEVIRRVASSQASQTLRSFLEGVVVRGTAKKAYIEGWRIAGKTGTAQKMDEKGQTYSQSKYIASFVGMFPADNPQIVGLVTLDEPKRIHWGGELSAPVFRNIVERIFGSPNMIEMRSQDQFTKNVPKEKKRSRWTVPDVRNMRVDVAEQFMDSRKLKTRVLGQGDIVMDQEPKPGEYSSPPDEVKIVLARSEKNVHGERYIPNVVGLTIREAINKLAVENLDVKVIGSGIVTKQTPPARFHVQAGQKILLECNIY
jgi:stage V sporulation protein D (sporulation-specific penicillin-binding protein)